MAISFVAASTVTTGANPTATLPSGYARGDLLIWICTSNTATVSPPSGFTAIATQGVSQFLTVATKTATADELTSAYGGLGTSTKMVTLAYRGAGALQAVPLFLTGTSTAPSTNTLTTTYANDFVLSIYANAFGAARTWTANASTTSRVNSATTTTIQGLLVADELKATAGVTTARAATISVSSAWTGLQIAIIESRTVYWVGGNGNWDGTATTNWSNTSGGAGGVVAPSGGDAVIVNGSSGSPTINFASGGNNSQCASLTTTGATCNFTSTTGSLSVWGGITLSATTTWAAPANIIINGPGTITTNGVTISATLFTVNVSGGTVTLGSNLTLGSISVFTFTIGTLALSTFTLSCFGFSSTAANTRAIQFGTGNITARGGSGFNIVGTNLTYTGTPTLNLSDSSATTRAIVLTSFTATNALDVNVTAGTGSLSVTTASFFKSLNFTGFAGTWSPGASTATFYGNLTLVSGMTFTAGSGAFTFANTSGTATITSASKTLGPITQSGAGGTVALGSNLTITSSTTGLYTLTNGTLNLANFTLSAGGFSSANSNTRVIQFGTGNITTTSTGTAFNVTASNLTYTGTPTVNISNNSATATTVTATSFTATNALNFNFTTGTYALTITSASGFKNLNFTGFTGTYAPGAALSIYGSLTAVSGMTWTTGSGTITFASTTAETITTAGKTLRSTTFNGVGGSWTLQDDFITTNTFTLTNGTFNANNFNVAADNFSITGTTTRTLNMGSGTWTVSGTATGWNATTTTNLTLNASTSTIAFSAAGTVAVTFAGGGLTYSTVSLTGVAGTGDFIITGANTFGTLSSSRTGIYVVTLPAGVTTTVGTWSIAGTSIATNLVTLNSSTVGTQATLSVASGTVNPDYATIQDSNATGGATFTATNAANLGNNTGWFGGTQQGLYWVGGTGSWNTSNKANWSNVSGGTGGYALPAQSTNVFFDSNSGTGTITTSASSSANSLDATGSSFTFNATSNAPTIYGNFTLSATTVWSPGTTTTFAATSTGKTITTNGVSLNGTGAIFNGVGGGWTLQDNFNPTGGFTLTNGTFNANNFNVTTSDVASSGSSVRTLTMGSGTWTLTGTGTIWTTLTSTNLTLNANTSTIILSNTSATAKTFSGGGKTFYNLVIGAGAGVAIYTIAGSNTFNTISSNKTSAYTITLTAGTTTTVTDWTATGTSGNLLTLNSSTVGTRATLSKASGTVSVDYLSIRDSQATGGASWYAGANSVDVNNNLGWIFASPFSPIGTFFQLF